MDDQKSRAVKEQQLRASINAKLIETGERERYDAFFSTKKQFSVLFN
jgi:hypothetical protein